MKPRRRGSALMEFAIIAPTMIVMAVCMIQFGLVLQARIALSNVARQASRYVARHGRDYYADTSTLDKGIKPKTVAIAASSNVIIGTGDVTLSSSTQNTTTNTNRKFGDELTIKISYDIRNKYFLPTYFWGVQLAATTITSSTMVRLEQADGDITNATTTP